MLRVVSAGRDPALAAVIAIIAGFVGAPAVAQLPGAGSLGSPTLGSPTPMRQVAFVRPLQDDAKTASNAGTSDTNTKVVEPAPLTSANSVAAEIERVTADETMDPMLRDLVLAALQELAKVFVDQRAIADALAGVEKSIASIESDKAAAKRLANKPLDEVEPGENDYLSIEEVKQNELQATTALAEARERLQKAEAAIATRTTRLEKLPADITALRREIETLEATSVGKFSDDPNGRLQDVRESLRAAQIDAAKERLSLLVREQLLYEAQAELLPLQLAAERRNVRQAEATYDRWSGLLKDRRQSQIREELRQYERQVTNAGGEPEQSQILRLGDLWVEIIGETDHADRSLAKEKLESAKWSAQLAETEAQIAAAKRGGERLSSSMGLQLQLMKNRLPSINHISGQIDMIDALIEKRRDLQRQLEMSLQGMDDSVAGELPMEVFSDRVLLGTSRASTHLPSAEAGLLGKFILDLQTHLTKLAERRSELENLRATLIALSAVLDSHVIWIRNESIFHLGDISSAWKAFRWMVRPRYLRLLGVRLAEGFWDRPALIVLALLAIGTVVLLGSRVRRRIIELGKTASSRQNLSLQPTLTTALLSFVLMLPLVVLLWTCGAAFHASGGDEPIVQAIAEALSIAAIAVWPIELLRQWLRPSGLAIAHFQTDEDSIRGLRRWLRILIDIGVPLLVLNITATQLGRYQLTQALSRVMLMAGMGLLSMVLWRTLEPKKGIFSVSIQETPQGWLARLRHIWFLPIVWTPIAFMIISMMGYGSAAEVLIRQFYFTFCLFIVVFFISGATRRWLLTQRRRLAWAVHRERIEESERLGQTGVEVEPTATLEASEINAQTSRLINAFLSIGSVIGVAWIWSPVLPAVGYLEAIQLWPSIDEKGEISYITLADLVRTIPILVLTLTSVRNLPGLIEAVLLERLPLEKPVRYAITTLGTYMLMFIGLAMSAKTLGLRWDNIQWLVAALGVGLGFGLQEIFANFISGLILLFEQPIRVGDVVTLGDTTGVVARIQMRATTVTNWDRQELVIPNKDLITGRLINWTLTDTTNRIVIEVGVAYGSDTNQACEVLRAVCRENEWVADDPGPVITFEGFGDSTLKLVLRCYLADLENRLHSIHELHTAINQAFQAEGIEIAFPQRDLHLRSLPPELIESLKRPASS
ncbi:mechanosensitive ion channel domain-containing protein [Allorhodopirellula heiligendammensis]|uniref:Miniconductance mechanosensitive channel MscM n=1 Tax=Allorhodopirellula heiligendammensis TaxID=2714739 RepID=A0A5C6BHF1_9BACT|nr:mechanosensitive ion channel domain-containing protein [Allorhodopirellula heiligendammensis]TWU10736.1 Miniconductance mechanosensitive channel MscM precursor [Allorhodopirellula heiligendammensis]